MSIKLEIFVDDNGFSGVDIIKGEKHFLPGDIEDVNLQLGPVYKMLQSLIQCEECGNFKSKCSCEEE